MGDLAISPFQSKLYKGRMVDWHTVEAFALSLEGVSASTSYGEPSLKIGKVLLTRLRTADNSIVLKSVDCDERDNLIEAQPEIYFLEDHYRGYDIVLARMDHAALKDLAPFIERTWAALRKSRGISEKDRGPPV